MTTNRKLALAAGVAYLITFASSIPALIMKAPVLDNPDFVLGVGSESSVLWAGLLDFVCALAGVVSAVALWPVLMRFSPTRALGFVTSRVIEGVVIAVGVVSLLAIVTLRQDATAASDANTLMTTASSLLAVHNWTFLFGPGVMPALNALCFATIMYRSGLVPRWIPTVGLIGAPLLLASSTASLFGAWDQVSSMATLMALPIATWELSVAVYMTVKGFRPSSVLDDPIVERDAVTVAA